MMLKQENQHLCCMVLVCRILYQVSVNHQLKKPTPRANCVIGYM